MNHEKLLFSSPSSLIHCWESFHKIISLRKTVWQNFFRIQPRNCSRSSAKQDLYGEGSKWRSDSCQLATKIELYIYRSVHIYRIRSEEEAGSGRPDTITCAPLLHFQKRIAVCCYQRDSLLLKQCRRSGKWFWWLPEAEKHRVPFQDPNAATRVVGLS